MPYRSKEYARTYQRKRAREGRQKVNDLKKVPCVDCGGTFPHYVMEFDHVPERGIKKMDLPRFGGVGFGSPLFLEELKKCDVVCANCHKIRTHKRRTKLDSSSDKTHVS